MTTSLVYPPDWQQQWDWNGLEVSFVHTPAPSDAAPTASTVVLIHGFGACKEHWRHTVPALKDQHRVVALDLVGFGNSAKPASRLKTELNREGWLYGIDSWADQVVELILQHVSGPVQLVGNSIGGVVALAAAQKLEHLERPATQVVLIDCAQRNLDDKRLSEQPPLRRWGRPLLKSLVRQRWFTRLVFRSVVNRGVIRKVLLQAYPSGRNVDEQLIDILITPAQQAGAEEAFHGFINLFDDRLAPEILGTLSTPVAMIWGEQDPWEPIAEAERWQRFSSVKSLHRLPNAGHCPHDEDPTAVNDRLMQLLEAADHPSC
jgi:pimeloyl-ACP methyl ester carboxylesterase